MLRRQTVTLVMAGLLLASGGFMAGRLTGDDITWRTGLAIVTDHEGSPQLSVVSHEDRVTYGAGGSLRSWTDAQGEAHADSWPDCLLPPTEEHPDRSQTVAIRFATVPIDDGDYSGPMIVSVDCRPR